MTLRSSLLIINISNNYYQQLYVASLSFPPHNATTEEYHSDTELALWVSVKHDNPSLLAVFDYLQPILPNPEI